jgi:hypothetical protein
MFPSLMTIIRELYLYLTKVSKITSLYKLGSTTLQLQLGTDKSP